jgi:hypothetical protein
MDWMIYKKIKIGCLVGVVINALFGCSGWETVTLSEYKKVEQLRGQPDKINVYTSDFSRLYHFSHSNYYIQNDTLFGKGYSGEEIVLTNIGSIQYYYEVEQEVEVYYDSEKDSIVGYKNAGAKAYIRMNDGNDYTGELLRVQNSIMIVCEEYGADAQELADSVYAIYVLDNREIELIELYAGNYLATGILVGPFAGMMIAGGVSSRDTGLDAVIGGFFGGMIIGGIVGFISTDYEDVYEQTNPEEYDFKTLNIYARYVNNEPEFLKRIK